MILQNDYIRAQAMQLVYTLLPNPGAFISGKGMDVIQAGGAIIGSKSKEHQEQKRSEESVQLKEAQRFVKPGRSFGTAGQLLSVLDSNDDSSVENEESSMILQ